LEENTVHFVNNISKLILMALKWDQTSIFNPIYEMFKKFFTRLRVFVNFLGVFSNFKKIPKNPHRPLKGSMHINQSLPFLWLNSKPTHADPKRQKLMFQTFIPKISLLTSKQKDHTLPLLFSCEEPFLWRDQ
jgi:hypothetical protein